MVETGTSSKNANSGGVYGNIKSLAIVLALQEQISNKKGQPTRRRVLPRSRVLWSRTKGNKLMQQSDDFASPTDS